MYSFLRRFCKSILSGVLVTRCMTYRGTRGLRWQRLSCSRSP